jgi:CheY-like chemotaxis protein
MTWSATKRITRGVDSVGAMKQTATRELALDGVRVPNVMLSDIQTPGEDALIRKVRALPPDRGGQTPAAALTGLTAEDDRVRVLRAGFQYHVAKPVDARRLVDVVTALATSA